MSTKRKAVKGFIVATSPIKKKYLGFRVQTAKNDIRKAICFNTSKCGSLKDCCQSGTPVTLRNVKHVTPDNPNFAELIFDDSSSLEISSQTMDFEKTDVEEAFKTVQEVQASEWEPPNNYVNIRGVIVFNFENKVKRAGFDLIEGTFGDTTGSMPISIWSQHIDNLLEARNIAYEIKGIPIKTYKGVLRFSTGASTWIRQVPATNEEETLYTRYHGLDVEVVNELNGTVELLKDFTSGSKCKFCERRMAHPITLKKTKCNACGSLQLTTGNVRQMSVTIMVNNENLVLHDDVIEDSGLQIENIYDEEELSEALLGKEVNLRFTDNIVTYLHI